MTRENTVNRLSLEKSPYLLQHADNPVDWYPWGEEAFSQARDLDRPVFLSIGYSTCHWCHVMAHESFEDPQVAALLNEAFVSVKVDREERPDIDHLYMEICQAVTGSGGWPLTIIMTPDKRPFFAATYIPKGSRYGMKGLVELIPMIKDLWENHRPRVLETGEGIISHVSLAARKGSEREIGKDTLDKAFVQLKHSHDMEYGGFGGAPKFPTPHNLLYLLRYWKRTDETEALAMVERTLRSMRLSGVYDHLGFGFHRYSTDRKWLVPHFEKMLYDQALLMMAYTEGYQATGDPFYSRTVREIVEYVSRVMTSPEGGFYSAEDADSEGEEGRFYLWQKEEIMDVLSPHEAESAIHWFSISEEGNYEDPHLPGDHGNNIIHLSSLREDIPQDHPLRGGPASHGSDSGDNAIPTPTGKEGFFEGLRKRLFHHRESRIKPHKDDKILTDWNGLMIAALAKASMALGDITMVSLARGASEFILGHMRRENGELHHRYRDGEAAIQGNLDDYAFQIWGYLEIYTATLDPGSLEMAIELTRVLETHFWDEKNGGFYFTPDHGEELLFRKKEYYDGAIPSGNAVMVGNLVRLARITGDTSLEERAVRTMNSSGQQKADHPSGFTQHMMGLDLLVGPTRELIIVGDPEAEKTWDMLDLAKTAFLPRTIVLFKPTGEEGERMERLAPYLKDYRPVDGTTTAYLCQGYVCKRPTTDLSELKDLLEL